jgi:hypothetical protein
MADDESDEPVRDGLNALGVKYNSQALIEY